MLGQLFKHIIPMDILLQLPLQQLHIMRDIRIKQLEEQQREMANTTRGSAPPASAGGMPRTPQIPSTAVEDLITELS